MRGVIKSGCGLSSRNWGQECPQNPQAGKPALRRSADIPVCGFWGLSGPQTSHPLLIIPSSARARCVFSSDWDKFSQQTLAVSMQLEQEQTERTEAGPSVAWCSGRLSAAHYPVTRPPGARWRIPPLPASVSSVSSCESLNGSGLAGSMQKKAHAKAAKDAKPEDERVTSRSKF